MEPPTPLEPVKPDYDGANVRNVIPAVLGARPVDWLPAPVAGARAAVLLVLDGLGWDACSSSPSIAALRTMEGGAITTVVPSTTAAALTSITTGLTPATHGIMGYRMRVDDSVLNAISWQRGDGGRAPDPRLVQRHDPFLGRPVAVVTKASFRRSGFTAAHLRGGAFHGWETPAVLVETVRTLVADGERFVYAYYPGIDEVAHAHGIEGREYAAEVSAADQLAGALLDALPDDVALLVTADHGQAQLDPDGWIGLDRLDDLVTTYAGEGRFRALFTRRGAVEELREAAVDLYGAHAWVFSGDELLDDGWFGPDPSPVVRRRVGDVVLAARDGSGFVDPTFLQETGLVGTHGSLTPAEMWVPLLAARGRS
ncbi:MAG TPA: alkaline phosphatase family protein [Acidimicrobiia bacterium]|nr:alkaline phosphatase family protein [Acidimicrobiia bacterium]